MRTRLLLEQQLEIVQKEINGNVTGILFLKILVRGNKFFSENFVPRNSFF